MVKLRRKKKQNPQKMVFFFQKIDFWIFFNRLIWRPLITLLKPLSNLRHRSQKCMATQIFFHGFIFFLFFFLAFSGYRVVGLNRQAMAIKPSSLKIDVNWILRVPGPCYWGCSLDLTAIISKTTKKNHKNRKKGFDLMDRIETNVIYFFFLHILYCKMNF